MRAGRVPRERVRRRRYSDRVDSRVGRRLRGGGGGRRGVGHDGTLDDRRGSCIVFGSGSGLCELLPPLSSSLTLSTLLLRSGLRGAASNGDGGSVLAFAPLCVADLLGDAMLALCVPGLELCGRGGVVCCWVVHDRREFCNAYLKLQYD